MQVLIFFLFHCGYYVESNVVLCAYSLIFGLSYMYVLDPVPAVYSRFFSVFFLIPCNFIHVDYDLYHSLFDLQVNN